MENNKQLLLKKISKILIVWSIIGIQGCKLFPREGNQEGEAIHSSSSSSSSYSAQTTTTTQTQPTEEQIKEAKTKEKIEELKKQAPPTEEEKNNIIAKANKKLTSALTSEQQKTLDENSKAAGYSIAEVIERYASIGINACNKKSMQFIKQLSSKKLEPKELAKWKEIFLNAKDNIEEIKKAQAANATGGN
jgi:hypothetical protein